MDFIVNYALFDEDMKHKTTKVLKDIVEDVSKEERKYFNKWGFKKENPKCPINLLMYDIKPLKNIDQKGYSKNTITEKFPELYHYQLTSRISLESD